MKPERKRRWGMAVLYGGVLALVVGSALLDAPEKQGGTASDSASSPTAVPSPAPPSLEVQARKVLEAASRGDDAAVAAYVQAAVGNGSRFELLRQVVTMRVDFHDPLDAERLVRAFLDGPDPAAVGAPDAQLLGSVLQQAAYTALDFVEPLIRSGADVNVSGPDRSTPLLRLADRGRPELVRLLLERQADANAADGKGLTPLAAAMHPFGHREFSDAHREVVRLLLDAGANPNAADGEGLTPLALAARYNEPGLVGLLLDRGADVRARDQTGRTPLMEAVEASEGFRSEDLVSEVVSLLLDHGARAEVEDPQGRSAITMARERGLTKVEALLNASFRPEWLVPPEKVTLLPESAAGGNADKLEMLRIVNRSVQLLNARDRKGYLDNFFSPDGNFYMYDSYSESRTWITSIRLRDWTYDPERLTAILGADLTSISQGTHTESISAYIFRRDPDGWHLFMID